MRRAHPMHTFLAPVLLLTATCLAQQRPAPWTGRVVDVLGEPIPAARVLAHDANNQLVGRGATDAEGVYRLGRLPPADVELRIEADGYVPRRLPWQGPTTSRSRNLVLEQACRLTGQLTDSDGRPLADAEVLLVCALGTQRAHTDADGRYLIAAAPLRQVRLRAWHDRRYGDADLLLHHDLDHNLQLDRTAFVRDIVIAGATLPEQGALVQAYGQAMMLLPDCGHVELRASAEGLRATLVWSERSDVLLTPSIPGFVTQPEGRIISPIERRLPIEFRAVPAAGRHRTVLTGTVSSYRHGAVGEQQLLVRDVSGVVIGEARCNTHGTFRLEGVVPDNRALWIGMPLGEWYLLDPDNSEQAVLREGYSWHKCTTPGQPIELNVEPCSRLDQPVRDADGTLLALADVIVADPTANWRTLLLAATDAGGNCLLALPPGVYALLVVGHDGRVVQGSARFPTGGLATEVEWQPVATGTVDGVVKAANGTVLPGVEVMLRHEAVVFDAPIPVQERLLVRVRTDRDGHFRCRGLPIGEWTALVVGREDVAGQTFRVARDASAPATIGR